MSYRRSARLFLRLLGLVYLAAFWSLGVQILGLVGHDGIMPAARLMASATEFADVRGLGFVGRLLSLPTMFWLSTSDRFLQAVCAGGSAMAILLMLGTAPAVVL